MNFELNPEDQEIRSWARKLSKEIILPMAEKHSREKLSADFLRKLSSEGLMKLMVPETHDGMGLTAIQFSLVIRELARACASTAVSVAVTNMIADVLVREGNATHHQKFLKLLTLGESLTASFCLTENQSGSDAGSIQTRAEKKGSQYVIRGEKIYVTNGAFSKFFLVMARSLDIPGAKGISAFLVDRESPGLVIGKEEEKMGLEGSSTIRMSFDGVSVPEENRIAPEGEGLKVALRALDGGRISVASQALGIAEASLEAGIRYAKEREAFGKPIADFQAIQWKIADSMTKISASEALILRAAFMKDKKMAFTHEASQAKLFATESAIQVCDDMIQILGGYGYIKDYPVERYYRDVRVTSLYEGTSEIQRKVIARALLSN